MSFSVAGIGRVQTHQFGRHSAANAAAVLALLHLLRIPREPARWCRALSAFRGVKQRFELTGCTAGGVPVYSDYAHNVEKICATLRTAQELRAAPVLAVFQPHGFGPLGFMRQALRDALRSTLRTGDRFLLLPVYYAGGTTTFQPTSEAVARDYREAGLPVEFAVDRDAAASRILAMAASVGTIVVMGARDPSLPVWARQLTTGSCA
jgi:UDP-N-acetylmuramate--alanine ligase